MKIGYNFLKFNFFRTIVLGRGSPRQKDKIFRYALFFSRRHVMRSLIVTLKFLFPSRLFLLDAFGFVAVPIQFLTLFRAVENFTARAALVCG